MNEEISYSEGAKKVTPEMQDAEIEEMKQASLRKIEQAQMDAKTRAEAGLTDIPKTPESVPKELPKMMFKVGAKIISCERFNLDDEEAKVMAKHLSILIGAVSSRWYSVIIIFIILISKISDCWSGLKKALKHGKQEQTQEMKEQGRPPANVMGDGT